MSDLETRVAELGITIPDPLPAGGLYSSVVIDGDVAYCAGTVAVEGPPIKLAYTGRLGDDMDIEQGKLSARGAMLSTLGNLKGALGDLGRIERFLRLTGYVRATHDFTSPPAVMDGASELLRDLFGADRLPARSAIGVAALPGGASVELDAIVKLRS
jgi:enamine deaminase RidA (YjgF/YER057c/UK114 family)